MNLICPSKKQCMVSIGLPDGKLTIPSRQDLPFTPKIETLFSATVACSTCVSSLLIGMLTSTSGKIQILALLARLPGLTHLGQENFPLNCFRLKIVANAGKSQTKNFTWILTTISFICTTFGRYSMSFGMHFFKGGLPRLLINPKSKIFSFLYLKVGGKFKTIN